MKKPFKLKYKNSAFPFKGSPAKFMPVSEEFKDRMAQGRLERGEVEEDRSHTHTQEYIIGSGEGGETTEDIGTAITEAGQQMGIGGKGKKGGKRQRMTKYNVTT